jgi:hypothetical protein
MRLRVFFREPPVLFGSAALVAGIAASGVTHRVLSGELKFDNWGFCAAIAVFVTLQARRQPQSQ